MCIHMRLTGSLKNPFQRQSALLFSGSYFNSKKWSYKKRYRITPFLELKVTPLVVLKCNTTFGAILTPFSGVKI